MSEAGGCTSVCQHSPFAFNSGEVCRRVQHQQTREQHNGQFREHAPTYETLPSSSQPNRAPLAIVVHYESYKLYCYT